MAEVKKISIALTTEQISLLKSAVDSGEYATTSEIVREAIRDWQFQRNLREEDILRLRTLWDQGKASGAPVAVDFESARREARASLTTATREEARVV
jgi:antitoxin ParD1/3/4